MNKIKYLLKRIFNMNTHEMFETIKRIKKKTHKNSLIIFLDIIYCGLVYMAGYKDYEVFEFYNLNKKQRKTFITRGINNKFVKLLNDKEYINIIDNKILFNIVYNDFLNRKWLDLRKTKLEDFKKYLKNQKIAIAKPIDLSCGKNVEKIIYNDKLNIDKLYIKLKQNKQYLIEDYVRQHKELNRLYPESVNTLRIVTILKDDICNIAFRSIRIGNNGNIVDNFNNGGLFTTVEEDGIIRKPAVDKLGNVYNNHPYTNTEIVGYKIPFFKEAIEFAKKLAKVTPKVRYTGWDICITEKGPIVIEGNPFPGHDIYQSKIHLNENGEGMLPKFKKLI